MAAEDVKEKYVTETAIVKHSNQLSEMPLQGFTAKEIDLFFGICYFVQNKGQEEVVIPFDELRNLLGIERRGDKKLKEEMQETAFKFSKISVTEESENEFYTIVPFYGFRLNTKTKTFAVQVHKDFVKALNGLDGTHGNTYTLSDVRAISNMNSVFSKQALKMMFLYRKTGHWYVTLENLRYFLDIPSSYKLGNITQRVIEPIRKECLESGIFDEFEIQENKDESQSGKGRKKVIGYTFKFKFKKEYFSKENYEKKEGVIPCPKCGKPLYKIERNDGTGYFFGHYGGQRKDAECSYTAGPAIVASSTDIVEDTDEEEVNISKGNLEKYYAHLRDEAQTQFRDRCEEIRVNRPEVWSIYKEGEKLLADLVNQTVNLRLLDNTEQEDLREKMKKKRDELGEELVKAGYEEDYLRIRYKCEECKDSGMLVNGYFCSCRKERAREAQEWIRSGQ